MRRKLVEIVGMIALAAVASASAFAQMGGGGMMGGYGAGGGSGMGMMSPGMMGGYGMGPGNAYGYGPGANGGRRDATAAPKANRPEASIETDPDPLDQLDLSGKQLGAIGSIRAGLKDRQSNLNRRLEVEQDKLRKLYDAPQRDRPKIDAQFRRIEELRREMFESSIEANERIEAQLSAEQRQRLHRISPRWKVSG